MSNNHIEYTDQAAFSAGEAAEFSGVNSVLQQHWRKRGLFPHIEGERNVRFSISEVVRMTIMQRLTGFSTA